MTNECCSGIIKTKPFINIEQGQTPDIFLFFYKCKGNGGTLESWEPEIDWADNPFGIQSNPEKQATIMFVLMQAIFRMEFIITNTVQVRCYKQGHKMVSLRETHEFIKLAIYKMITVMRLIYLPLLCFLCSVPATSRAQEPVPDKDLIFKAASEIINQVQYCALVTLDETGQPQARMMEPFPPEENFIIWFGTNKNSRKVKEIKNDPRVTVYYGDDSGSGYVVIMGTAVLVDDQGEKEKRWMEHWAQFYPERKNYLLIKVVPQKLEVISFKYGLTGDPVSWRAPHITITSDQH